MNLVCVWWKTSDRESGVEWSQRERDRRHCNVVWLSLVGISCVFTIDVITEMRVGENLLDAVFSHSYPNQLLTIEQSQSSSTKFLIDACTYELIGKKTAKIYS